MSSPFREQRLAPEAVRRILRRAAELAGRDPDSAADARSLTLAELERHAGELGLGASVVRRAVDARDASDEPAGETHVSLWTGTRLPLLLEQTVYGTLSDAHAAELGETISWVMGPGKLTRDGGRVVWQAETTRGTPLRELTVSVLAQRGRVRIRIEEGLGALAGGLIGGVGIGAGLLVGFFALRFIAPLINLSSEIGAVAIWMGFPAVLSLIMRALVGRVARRREAQLKALMVELRETVEAGLDGHPTGATVADSSAPGVRVAVADASAPGACVTVAERAARRERRTDEFSQAMADGSRRRER